ncbi:MULTISPECIES: ornithine cyclodeaminase family protein [unclassified Sedimentibacter]|uniref:ornithine cyclodeaminase family protein n=1 Tax=unclassified Sedimentibacter TaxID=2649220 RepID=UPI0027E04F1B|nr:ornithine cyclodeaminase family protein [Sedimentibacter sp. MB35-C1]WMJ78996.1 ornithine cyclodeaminase family protein [Sedimentibacter sp. MB35-C1]
MNVIILKKDDICKIFSMKDAIKACRDALKIYSEGGSSIPLRTNIDIAGKGGQSLYMPGYAEGANALGIKIVSVYPNNVKRGLTAVPSTMVLLDEETGMVNSIIDGTYLTQIRTGAVSGAATDILARKDSAVLALIGTGGQAESQLDAVLSVRDIKEVRIHSKNIEHARKFADKMREKYKYKPSIEITAVLSSGEAVTGADIITTVTTSMQPTFDGRLIKKGAHINGVGSYTPAMQELDEWTLLNADKVYVDTRDGVLNESGDFIIPMKEGKFTKDIVTGELGEVILGKVPSRENEDEVTLFKTVGSSILDIVTSRRIYEKALASRIGKVVEI